MTAMTAAQKTALTRAAVRMSAPVSLSRPARALRAATSGVMP